MTGSRSAFLVVALLSSLACTSTSAPVDSSSDAIVGVWSLQSWDGKSLPAITYGTSAGYNEQIVSERFELLGDGTYKMDRTVRYMPAARNEVQTGGGQWKKNSTAYVIGGGLVSGTLSGETLTVGWKGDGKTNWVYARSK